MTSRKSKRCTKQRKTHTHAPFGLLTQNLELFGLLRANGANGATSVPCTVWCTVWKRIDQPPARPGG